MELAPSLRPSPTFRVLAGLGLTAWVLLSVFPPSTSRLLIWPVSLPAALFWGMIACTGIVALFGRARLPRLLELGLLVVAGAAVVSAWASPFRGVALPAAWTVLGACLLPLAVRPWFEGSPDRREEVVTWIGWAVVVILAASIAAWILLQVAPALRRGATLVQALGERNEQPFGHANYTAAFALLALGWMLLGLSPWLASRIGRAAAPAEPDAEPPSLRGEWVLGAVLALAALFTSSSRAGIGALGIALLTTGLMARRHFRQVPGRVRIVLLLGLVATLLVGTLTNQRLRVLITEGRWNATSRESNRQRLGLTQGAWLLGVERPVLGWGPGTVPHVFPKVRAHLPGNIDNALQVHSSPLQTWATLGGIGLCGVLLLAAGGLRLLHQLSVRAGTVEEGLADASLGGSLVGFAAFTLFDHSLDVPAMAGLAGLSLAALASRCPDRGRGSPLVPAVLAGAGLLVLIPGLWSDLQARRLHSSALDAWEARDAGAYEHRLAAASRALPASPYLDHLRASWLATGDPFGGPPPDGGIPAAIALLEGTLQRNPYLEYAHYNLGWLLLDSQPAEAERHFAAAARLAPHRVGVYLGLGLARASQGQAESAVSAFAAERVNSPEQAFARLFSDPSLADVARDVRSLASEFLRQMSRGDAGPAASAVAILSAWEQVQPTDVQESPPFRRVRPGYGLLMGFPEGRPPSDVNPMTRLIVPADVARTLPKPGWLAGGRLLELARISPAP